jgi:MinD-like ATPase involved in chromosome partitioning or flagellar assembly
MGLVIWSATVSPPWITFYSVRGGVGRSTLLALCALELARRGRRVIALDFDLEAPGLDILFGIGAKGAELVGGVVDYLASDLGAKPLLDYVVPVELPGNYLGRLFVLPAGRCDNAYLSKLDGLHLKQMYERTGLLNPVRALRSEVEGQFQPDVVLVDSRTGYSDAALLTLFDLADAVVTVLIPDAQNVERLVPVLERLTKAPKKRELFFVANKYGTTSNALRELANVEDRLRSAVPTVEEADEEGRPFVHRLPFESAYLTLQKLMPPLLISEPQRQLADDLDRYVDGFGVAPEQAEPAVPGGLGEIERNRRNLLGNLFCGAGGEAADFAEKDDVLLDGFFYASLVKESLRPQRLLIRGRKGAGKTALYRLLTERPEAAVLHCPELDGHQILAAHGPPSPAFKHHLRSEDFWVVQRLVQEGAVRWKDLWRMYAAVRILEAQVHLVKGELREQIASIFRVTPTKRKEKLEVLLGRGSHVWSETLLELAREVQSQTVLVYDNLDAGFGSEKADLNLRRAAVTGLLDAWAEDGPLLERIRPKILLREDVFLSLTLANVNQWRSRDVELRWDFPELAELLAQRAKLDPNVAAYIREHVGSVPVTVPHEALEFVVLFDERVRPREKQARTWLTARNRLADALENRFPRDYLRLAFEAVRLERGEPTAKRQFAPALIAGAHTVAALRKVSDRRAADLRDEFPSYTALLESMKGISSPFEESMILKTFSEALADTAADDNPKEARRALDRLVEYGVIGQWDDAGKLFVPDLYLRGLGMYRHGW